VELGVSDIVPSPLTDAQREIMQVVWARGEATVSEVRDALASRKLARNTIQTMMVRLEEKGWLKHREEGRRFRYSAKVTQRTSLGAKVVQLVDHVFAGSPEDMVSALVEYRGLTKDEAMRIRAMIDKAEASTKSKR
jgi:predicted transcriptional regulator